MTETRIVLADDHQVVRLGLRTLLESQPGFTVVAEAGDGLQAVQQVKDHQPDVLVLDLMMPGMTGMEVCREVMRKFPETRIVILSMYNSEAYIADTFSSGAIAYVLKQSTTQDLAEAIHSVSRGERYLSPSLSEQAVEIYLQYLQQATEGTKDPLSSLTPRENQVLHLAALGSTNTEIADQLQISRRTVETHRANMMHKLGLNSHLDLLRFAMEKNILPIQNSSSDT